MRIWTLFLAVTMFFSSNVWAQEADQPPAEEPSAEEAPPAEEPPAEEPPATSEEGAPPSEEGAPPSEEGGPPAEGGAKGGAAKAINLAEGEERSYWRDIKVVPRKLILKVRRFELVPYFGVTLNDNLIRHYMFGGEFSYHMSDVLSFGIGGHWYQFQMTDRAYLTGLQQRVLPTLNKYLYTVTLNANYEAAYGKMAVHNKKILQWGVFLSGGLGITGTEVIPRNATHEPWTNTDITIQFGVGVRVFLSKWLTLYTGVRNYMFLDKFENPERDEVDGNEASKDASTRFINNITFQLGLSVFYPTDFEYTTFK